MKQIINITDKTIYIFSTPNKKRTNFKIIENQGGDQQFSQWN